MHACKVTVRVSAWVTGGLAPVLPGFADVQLRVVVLPVTYMHSKVLIIRQARDTPHLAEHGYESGA